jgi:hypothetical protein
LRESNTEDASAEDGGTNGADAAKRADEELRKILGDEKATQVASFANEYWAKGDPSAEGASANTVEMLKGPNAVPTDTRVVVNIPAFRMDLFQNGSLVKSYKVGIGYPEFPLPFGLRKVQTVIFNPPWTPPDSPWVAKIKNATPGETIEPGSKDNPLGIIKIPIGLPSLIHGGKSPAKIGKFASHGCVGLTNAQVKDFATLLLIRRLPGISRTRRKRRPSNWTAQFPLNCVTRRSCWRMESYTSTKTSTRRTRTPRRTCGACWKRTAPASKT